jgi:hypothetical protein
MKNFRLILIILIAIQLISCRKDNEHYYPKEPNIEFKYMEISMVDTIDFHIPMVNLILNYSDGDSNIFKNGLNDTSYNCITTLYKKTYGNFNLYTCSYNPRYFGIRGIEKPHQIYNQGAITIKTHSLFDGEIQIEFYCAPFIPWSNGDTLKATVQIIDKVNNKSNIAEMEKIYAY